MIAYTSKADTVNSATFTEAQLRYKAPSSRPLNTIFNTQRPYAMDDAKIASLIQMADDPRDAKRFGDQIQPAKEWTDTIQFQVMEEGVKAKFATHPRLPDYLLATGRKTIMRKFET